MPIVAVHDHSRLTSDSEPQAVLVQTELIARIARSSPVESQPNGQWLLYSASNDVIALIAGTDITEVLAALRVSSYAGQKLGLAPTTMAAADWPAYLA